MPQNQRPFFEELFSSLTKGEKEKYYSQFDPNARWLFHGEHPFTYTYNNLTEIKKGYNNYESKFESAPSYTVNHLVVEGNKAIALLSDEGKRRDGTSCHIDYSLYFELNSEGTKILFVDHFTDNERINELNLASKAVKLR